MKRHFYLLLLFIVPVCVSGQAVITAIFDADLPGGLPKGTELYINQDIADLSLLGVGSANNGGGTDGVEFTFPAIAVDSGTYVYLASDSASFVEFFGFNADYITSAMAINGDDAIELFWDSLGIDIFGDIAVSGTGQPWEYTDGWAARKPMTGPDGTAFILQNWNFSGVAALDMQVTNATAHNPVPLKSYTDTTTVDGPDVTVILQNLTFTPQDITIELGQTVRWMNVENFEAHNVNGQQTQFPCNPSGFYSGEAALGPWNFDVTFNVSGFYDYQCDPHVSYGMFGSVTVVDPNAPEYPAYDISVVNTEDASGNADSSGTVCELQGVVHGPNFRPIGLQFTIIDVATEAGINVFKNTADCYDVTEGDLISVRGMITQFNGLTEIIPSEPIEVISSGNVLMDPIKVDGALDESMESLLVRVDEISTDSIVSTGTSGWNLFGTGPGGQYLVRLDADVFIDVSIYDTEIFVTGIVGQFDSEEPFSDGYQLQPRSPSDIDFMSGVTNLPQSAITLSPNPSSETIHLDTDLQVQKIKIYTTTGHIIYKDEFKGPLINISRLSTGVYVIVAETHEGSWTGKLIKS